MKKLLIFAFFISGVTLLGFWGGKKMCMHFMWPASVNPAKVWYFNLGLNPQQAEDLNLKETAFRPEANRFCTRICKERMDLLNLMRDPKTKPEVIFKKIEEIGALQIALEKQIAAHILEVKNDLTPEQSKAYLDRIDRELHKSIQKNSFNGPLTD